MNCKICGAEMQPEEKFCPNCGSSAETPEAVQPQISPTAQQPQPAQGIPQPAANPAEQPQPQEMGTSDAGVPPISGGMPIPEGAAMFPQAPAKKKRRTGLILTLILVPVVLILAVVITVICVGKSMYNTTHDSVETYWDAFTKADGEGYAALVPDAYWDYISETYDCSKEECIAGIELYLQENAEDLGGDLSYEWKGEGFEFNFGDSGDSEGAKDVKDHMKTYGMDYSASMGIGTNVTVKGADDTQEYPDTNVWLAKVDGEWYNMNAMVDFETICEEGYAQTAVYQKEFGEPLEQFWTAFYQADGDTVEGLLPEQIWSFLESEYGCTQSEAESYMQSYLDYVVASMGVQDPSSVTLDLTVTDVEEQDADTVEEYSSELRDYGMEITAVSYVTVDYDAVLDGQSESDSFQSTMIQIDSKWYVYEGMYMTSEACYDMVSYGTIG